MNLLKLNSYRFYFPRTGATSAGNAELTALLKMLNHVTTFRTEVLQIESFDTINDLVEDCCRKSHEVTYQNVFQECEEYQIRCSMSRDFRLFLI